jgi:hypothetical protein
MPPSRGCCAHALWNCPTLEKPPSPCVVRKTPVSCTKLCVMRKIRRIQMRNHPRIKPNSKSRKLSPPIHFRRQVDNMVPSSLRVFRDFIIFRENRRKCATTRFSPCAPRCPLSPVPCPYIFLSTVFLSHSFFPVPCFRPPVPFVLPTACRLPLTDHYLRRIVAHLCSNAHPVSIIQPSPAPPEKCNRMQSNDFRQSTHHQPPDFLARLPPKILFPRARQ